MSLYVSLDIETTGPVPGLHSMIQLGAVPILDGKVREDWGFSCWFKELDDARWDPMTGAWARLEGHVLAAHSKAEQEGLLREPAHGTADFAYWVENLPGKPIAAAWPAAFDFSFVNYYAHRFLHRNPLGFACLDIRSYVAGLYRQDYYDKTEPDMWWLAGVKDEAHEHDALADALRQAKVLAKALTFDPRKGEPNDREQGRP